MQQTQEKQTLSIRPDGFVCVEGVKIAKLVPERGVLQFLDRDRRSVARRGSPHVEVPLRELGKLIERT